MGVVYLAKNRLMDRLEVLKVVNKALLGRPGLAERFLREIRSGAQLRHPNVVTAYSALQVGELLVFAMEYVEGENLSRLVKSSGPLPVGGACSYAQQAALGLQHAFERGMVHRDIKPSNLILARDGKSHLVKILDFGLAKARHWPEGAEHDLGEATREQEGTGHGLTRTGQILGTPGYMAPEQSEDAARADSRADIYSLGCTLYFLLTGRPPFQGKSLSGLLQTQAAAEATPVSDVRQEVPAELAAVVAKMLAKDPAQRYQTPAEVAQALAPFVEELKPLPLGSPSDGTVKEKRPATEPRPTPGARGTRKWWGLAVVGLALFLLVCAARLWFPTQPADRQPEIIAKVKEVADIDLVPIPASEFDMGSKEDDKDAADVEKPRHRVRISKPFLLGKYKVTAGQFRRFVKATRWPTDAERNGGVGTWNDLLKAGVVVGCRPHEFNERLDARPVVFVSWDDAAAFCRWLAQETGAQVRLPREAEWEYSCRAGTTTKFYCGDNEANLDDYAWTNKSRDLPAIVTDFLSTYHPVQRDLILYSQVPLIPCGLKKPNDFGLYDMHGLVWEWCADGMRTYKDQIETDPEGPTDADAPRVTRGGGRANALRECRAASRGAQPPGSWNVRNIGFRVLVSP
jgi:formylglycine-generating enzyme required for sulfatase activity/tRNA A-37 threonylcarbamoyl transferase component Bud32